MLLTIMLLFLACAAGAQPPVPYESDAVNVTTVLQFDKPTYFLGENVIGYYGIINKGKTPITISIGGDYRGAPRPLRIIVRAVDAAGKLVDDPYTSMNSMGGMGGSPTIESGKTFWFLFSLPRYCSFTKPGKYTVTVYHDLGWDKQQDLGYNQSQNRLPTGSHKAPFATSTVTLVMPTIVQANKVITSMTKLPESYTMGERSKPYADFFALRYLIYLPMLTVLARNGNARAVEGIAAMPMPEATPVLAQLADSKFSEVARAAFWGLLNRLPPAGRTQAWGNILRGFPEVVWNKSLARELHNTAWTWLASTDRQRIYRGGELLLRVGVKKDLPRLLPVFDRTLSATKAIPEEQNAYLLSATACWTLRETIDKLLRLGAAAPDSPRTTAQRLCMLRAMVQHPSYKPTGWQQNAATLLTSSIPFVRMTTIESLPVPLESRFIAPVVAALHSTQVADQYMAASLAMRAKSPELRSAVMDLLAVATDHFTISEAYQAAIACGVARDRRIEACIHRLDDPKVAMQYYKNLSELTTPWYLSSYHDPIDKETAIKLKAAWEVFFITHKEEIRNGAIFDVEKPPFTRDLIPPDSFFHLGKENRNWPRT